MTMAHRKTRNLALSASQLSKCGQIEDLVKMGWRGIPSYLSSRTCATLPMRGDAFDLLFQDEIQPFSNQPSDSHKIFSSSVATGETVHAPFYMTGIGVVAVGESLGWSVSGATGPLDAVEGDGAPCLRECVGPAGGASISNAVLNWGHPIWDAFSHLFRAYELEVILGGRFQVVHEAISEVGMTAEAANFQGLGTAQISAMPYIRATNDAMKAAGMNRAFFPQNAAAGSDLSTCAPPPMPDVQWSHPKVMGLAQRIFCLPRGIVILPGQSLNINLNLRDDSCGDLEAMRRVLVLHDPLAPVAGLPSNLSDCGSRIDVQTVPGGSFAFGVVIKGVELAPAACLDWYENYCTVDLGSLYLNNQYVLQMATAYMAAGGKPKGVLAGLADPTGQTMRKLQESNFGG